MTRAPLPMSPSGLSGRMFSRLMEALNEAAYRDVLRAIGSTDNLRILEIGFGTGRLLEHLLRSGRDVTLAGLDPTPDMVARARRRPVIRKAKDRTDIRLGGAGALDWPDTAFDVVLALHSFQFWPDPAGSLKDIKRVLVPGGRLILALRDHSRGNSDWLPNPLSRGPDEWARTIEAVGAAGFVDVCEQPARARSRVLQAIAPRG